MMSSAAFFALCVRLCGLSLSEWREQDAGSGGGDGGDATPLSLQTLQGCVRSSVGVTDGDRK